jgi:D-sedoheptulose 7-phosphate isomerase
MVLNDEEALTGEIIALASEYGRYGYRRIWRREGLRVPANQLLETVASVGEKMVLALRDGKKLFFFGNGGSAADAQHLAAEFVGRFNRERRALPAIALTTDTSALTSISNDYSYESVFARQLEGLGSPGDIAVGISTSGSSPNVLNGIRSAKAVGWSRSG